MILIVYTKLLFIDFYVNYLFLLMQRKSKNTGGPEGSTKYQMDTTRENKEISLTVLTWHVKHLEKALQIEKLTTEHYCFQGILKTGAHT